MMLNLIPLLTVLSTIFLSSCEDDFPIIQPQERCVVVLENIEEGYKGKCRCHMYSWSITGIGRITESEDKPIGYCDRLVGFKPQSSAKIYEWQETIRLWLIRNQEKI